MFNNGNEMITAVADLLSEVPRKCEDCNFSYVNFNVLTARRCQHMMSLLNRMHSTDSSQGGLTLAGEEVAYEATDGEVKRWLQELDAHDTRNPKKARHSEGSV